mgnify:CR=1 FL=1
MKQITMLVDPAEVPAGAVCRLYHRDNNTYLGETVSDGSGTLVVEVPDDAIEEFYAEVAIDGVDGTSEPHVLKVTVE